MTRFRLIAAAVLVALLAAAFLIVANTYSLSHGDRDTLAGPYVLAAGETAEVAITVRNPGSISVEFIGVRLDSSEVAIDLVRMIEKAGQEAHCCLPEHSVGFRPVTLVAGSQLMLFLTLRVTGAGLYEPCTGFSLEQALVSYQVLYVSREAPIKLRTPISFQAPC